VGESKQNAILTFKLPSLNLLELRYGMDKERYREGVCVREREGAGEM